MALRGEGILPLLFCNEGFWPPDRGQGARDTQGRSRPRHVKGHPQAALEAATRTPTLNTTGAIKERV
jgi:hypothetical protein